MKLARIAAVLSTTAAVTAALSGCSASSPAAANQAHRAATIQPATTLHGSTVREFGSIAEIRAASPLVVVGRVLGATDGGPADQDGTAVIHARLTSLSVIASAKGGVAPGTVVTVRQFSDPDTNAPLDFVLRQDATYLLFLHPFTFGPGTAPTGQYVVTGAQGAYELASPDVSNPASTATLVSGIVSALPHSASLAALMSR